MAGGKIVLKSSSNKIPEPTITKGRREYQKPIEESIVNNFLDIIQQHIKIDKIKVDLTLGDNPWVPFKKRQYQLSKDLPEPLTLRDMLESISFECNLPNQPKQHIIISVVHGKDITIMVAIASKDGNIKPDQRYTPHEVEHSFYLEKKGITGSYTYTANFEIKGTYKRPE